MKFEIYTLIDITETQARFNKNDPLWHQQQNFMTVIQTLGLRANPVVKKSPTQFTADIKDYDFGSKFKGKKSVWHFEFEYEQQEVVSVGSLIDDFDLVPVITDLNEDAKFNNSMFATKDPKSRNIIFKCVD